LHLVIGAEEFAGIHVARALQGQASVRTVESVPRDQAALAAAMEEVEVVYACAEIPPDVKLPLLGRTALLLPRIVAAARAAGVKRLVYVSSADVLGSELVGRMSELSRPRPENGYERSKLREEQYLRANVDDLDWVIVRPARAIGAQDRLWSEHLLRKVGSRRRIWQVAGGRVFETFIAGPDLGRALVAAGKRGQPGHTYLIGGFDATWRELMEIVAERLGVRLQVQAVPFDLALVHAAARELTTAAGKTCWPNPCAVDGFGKPHLYDDSRTRRQLTWSPQIGSLAEVVGEVLRAYQPGAVSASPGK
jgi:nucleoside-diphosphate-sugar epimerase